MYITCDDWMNISTLTPKTSIKIVEQNNKRVFILIIIIILSAVLILFIIGLLLVYVLYRYNKNKKSKKTIPEKENNKIITVESLRKYMKRKEKKEKTMKEELAQENDTESTESSPETVGFDITEHTLDLNEPIYMKTINNSYKFRKIILQICFLIIFIIYFKIQSIYR